MKTSNSTAVDFDRTLTTPWRRVLQGIVIVTTFWGFAAANAQLDNEGRNFPDNPLAEATVAGTGCHSSQVGKPSEWGLRNTGTETNKQVYTAFNNQTVPNDSKRGIHFPVFCGDYDTGTNSNPGTYSLSLRIGNQNNAITSDSTLDDALKKLSTVSTTTSGASFDNDGTTDSQTNAKLSSMHIQKLFLTYSPTTITTVDINFVLEYDPGAGQNKQFFYALVRVVPLPPYAPEISFSNTVLVVGSDTVLADSSRGVRLAWSNNSSIETDTLFKQNGGTKRQNVINVFKGASRTPCSSHPVDLDLGDTNLNKEFTQTFILNSKCDGEASFFVSVDYVEVRNGKTDTGSGLRTPMNKDKSLAIGPISVGAGDAQELKVFPATGDTLTQIAAKTDVIFKARTNTDWKTRMGFSDPKGTWTWTATSSSNQVATVRANIDSDTNLDDDRVTITGVYAGTAAQSSAYVTVRGIHRNTTSGLIDDRLEEVIRVTVLKNAAPVFRATAATIRWNENDTTSTFDTKKNFVVEDMDTSQTLSFCFLDDDDNLRPRLTSKSGSPCEHKGFSVTEAGELSATSVNFEAGEEVMLTLHVSDGQGGTDVMALTIQIRDGNDAPTVAGKPELDLGTLLDRSGKRSVTRDVRSKFKDDDMDALCYEISGRSDDFNTFATGSLQGSSTCYSPRLTITMKSAVGPFGPGSDTSLVGKSGVEQVSVDVRAYEKNSSSTNREYTKAVKVSVHLVYGSNLAPVIWGGRTTDAANYPYLSKFRMDENLPFTMTVTAQDVQPSGDVVCFALKGTHASLFKFSGSFCPSVGTNSTYKASVTSKKASQMNYETNNGTLSFVVEATDLSGGVHALPFTISLNDVEEAPRLARPIADQFAIVGDNPLRINLDSHFSDDDAKDKGNLKYSAWSSNQHISTSISGNVLVLNVPSKDINNAVQATITVEAEDSKRNMAYDEFNVKLKNSNTAPMFDNGVTAITYSVNENSPKKTRVGTAATASDPDAGDTITYSFAEKTSLFSINSSTGVITVNGALDYENIKNGRFHLTLVAMDPFGAEASANVTILVRDVNEPPMFVPGVTGIADMTVIEGVRSDPCIMASNYFTDPDVRDQEVGLLINAQSSRRHVASVSVVNNEEICITGVDPGTGPSTITVTAEDRDRLAIKTRFYVTVAENLPPTVLSAVPDQTIQESGEGLSIDLDEYFDDGDGAPGHSETLTYTLNVSDVSVATATIVSGNSLRIFGDSQGQTVITLTAIDQAGGQVTSSFIVTVERNEPPVAGTVPDVQHRLGLGALDVLLDSAFRDDGDTFRIIASSADPDVATVAVIQTEDGPKLRVHAHSAGTTVVTLTAIDSGNNEATTSLIINIDERNDPPQLVAGLQDSTVKVDRFVDLSLDGVFSDTDDLTYTIEIEDNEFADVFIRGNTIRAYGNKVGSTLVAVTATDTIGQEVSFEFTLTVDDPNPAPSIRTQLSDRTIKLGTSPDGIAVDSLFSDSADDSLTYDVESDDLDVISASLTTNNDGSQSLMLSVIGSGSAVITLTATDTANQSVSMFFVIEVPVNEPPQVTGQIADVSVYFGAEAPTINLDSLFTDVDDELTLSVSSADPAVVQAALNTDASGMSYIAFTIQSAGSSMVTVTATDSIGQTASLTFLVAVPPNDPPTVAAALDDTSFYIDDDPMSIDVTGTFRDPDNEVLALTIVSSDDGVATAMLQDHTDGTRSLVITPVAKGTVMFTLTATDRAGLTVSTAFELEVKVNSVPVLVRELADATLTLGETPLSVRIDDAFEDPDPEDDVLSLSATSSNTDVATAEVDDGMLTVTSVSHGDTMITVTATDHRMASVSDVFDITVKTAPSLTDAAQNVLFNLQIGGDVLEVALAQYFLDADGDALTYAVEMTGDSVSLNSDAIADGMVTISPYRKGRTEVTATASDPDGRTASFSFAAEVSDSQIKMAAETGLAGYGRSVLSSVSSAISSRIESNRADRGVNFTKYKPVQRQPAPPIAAPQPQPQPQSRPVARESVQMPQPRPQVQAQPAPRPAPTAQPQQRRSGVSWNTLGNGNGNGSVNGSNFRMSDFVPKNFSQSLNGGSGVGSWSVWGTADSQNFEGPDYDGSGTNMYLGADVKSMNSLLLGAAIGRNSGSYDYSSGNATQTMDVNVTSVLPYFAYEPSKRSLVWGVIGGGRGEAETSVTNSEKESSDLSLFTGALGGRMTVAQAGSLELGVRGDFAYADLSTENGAGAADELSAAVNRMRIGVEGSFVQSFGNGAALIPYGELSVRKDGGDGLTGTGVEVAGGVRFGNDMFSLELSGRTLATHSEEDLKESGISLMAVLNSSAMGTGLSFSLTPSWGSSTQSQNAIWAERAALGMRQAGNGVGYRGRSLEARLGYGIPVLRDRYLLTPFVDYHTDDTDAESLLMGASLTQLIVDKSDLDFTFEFGRHNDGVEQSSNQFGLTAEMSF